MASYSAPPGSHDSCKSPSYEPHVTADFEKSLEIQASAPPAYTEEDRPFFVPIGQDGLFSALQSLDNLLVKSGRPNILSKKTPNDWFGKAVTPGQIGLFKHGGIPKILTRPGHYPAFLCGKGWPRSWCGTRSLSDTTIQFLGLTIVQLSQNQAAIVSDPQNRIFVVQNTGFVAYAAEGTYEILSIVDPTNLSTCVKHKFTRALMGTRYKVMLKSKINGQESQDYVAAIFLTINPHNCVVLRKDDKLQVLGPGQFVITGPNITLRAWHSLTDHEREITKEYYTHDRVKVDLSINLKWQLTSPLKLVENGWNTTYDALKSKAGHILKRLVSQMNYSNSLARGELDNINCPSPAFLENLRLSLTQELGSSVAPFGITIKDIAIIGWKFKTESSSSAQPERAQNNTVSPPVEASSPRSEISELFF